jgi:anti-sigma regulatory factor (Ser/Thr protein kinase)
MVRAVELVGRPASVREARGFTADVLADDGVEASVIEVAVLLVSELVTNAVVHARGPICLTVHTDAHWVRIEVEDPGHRRPVLRAATLDAVDGRGCWWLTSSRPMGAPNSGQPTRSSGSRSLAREASAAVRSRLVVSRREQ